MSGGLRGRTRRRVGRLSLRARLVAGVLVLVAAGLVVADVAGIALLRSYLLARVDDQLTTATSSAFTRGVVDLPPSDPGRQAPNPFLLYVVDGTGHVVRAEGGLRQGGPTPALPRLDSLTAGALAGAPFTTPAVGAGADFRVLVMPFPDGSGSLVVAQSLGDVDETVTRLAVIDAAVTLLAILVIAALALAVVGVGLRPLRRIERTSGEIARGDLTRRVDVAGEETEVGRLGLALNAMLARIEAAFRDREESEESLRRSEERLRRFVADASHELRTPLTSIRGYAELARQGALDGDPAGRDRAMAAIESAAARMGLLVEDLLLLARLDEARPLAREPVDLLALAADVVQEARTLQPTRPLSVEPVAGAAWGGPVTALGDRARLRQVVGNLVTNALTHTPATAAVTVRVGYRDGVPPGTSVAVVEVADAGPGMSAEQAAQAFDRFYRADRARARASGGSGLGLSIVAALVAAHDGAVELDTAPGQGATFRVLLPAAPRSGLEQRPGAGEGLAGGGDEPGERVRAPGEQGAQVGSR